MLVESSNIIHKPNTSSEIERNQLKLINLMISSKREDKDGSK